MPNDAIVYQFSRSKVERGDFSHFLSLSAPDKLPTDRPLREMIEAMLFWKFLRQDFVPMNALCERGQMFERLIFDRTRRVFEYFGLPFDAPPPA
jgi:hypothetical protein